MRCVLLSGYICRHDSWRVREVWLLVSTAHHLRQQQQDQHCRQQLHRHQHYFVGAAVVRIENAIGAAWTRVLNHGCVTKSTERGRTYIYTCRYKCRYTYFLKPQNSHKHTHASGMFLCVRVVELKLQSVNGRRRQQHWRGWVFWGRRYIRRALVRVFLGSVEFMCAK